MIRIELSMFSVNLYITQKDRQKLYLGTSNVATIVDLPTSVSDTVYSKLTQETFILRP